MIDTEKSEYKHVAGEFPSGIWQVDSYNFVSKEHKYKNEKGESFSVPERLRPIGESEINRIRKREYKKLLKEVQGMYSTKELQLEEFERRKDDVMKELKESQVVRGSFVMNVGFCNYDWDAEKWLGVFYFSNKTGERFPKNKEECYSEIPVDVPFIFPRENQKEIVVIQDLEKNPLKSKGDEE